MSLFDDLNKVFCDLISILDKGLSACWNVFMSFLISIKVMPFFQKRPIAMLWFIILLCFLLPRISIFILCMGYSALNRGVKADDKFIILVNKE